MKPTIETDRYALYLGDCRQVLPLLKSGCADLCLTDPPYGIDLDYGYKDDWRPDKQVWAAIASVCDYLHMTCSNRHLDYWLTEVCAGGWQYRHCSVYWNKCRAGGNTNGQFAFAWEPLLSFDKGKHKPFAKRMLSDVLEHTGRKQTDHPAERDLSAWTRFAALFDTDITIDPFMGSGTTGVACLKLGKRFIGIEKEESFFKIAEQRLRRAAGILPKIKVGVKTNPSDLFP